MNLSKAEIALYSAIAIGVFFVLWQGISARIIFPSAIAAAAVFLLVTPRRPLSRAGSQPVHRDAATPCIRWNRILVLALIAVLGGALAVIGAPLFVIALLCGFLLAAYGLHLFGDLYVSELFRRKRNDRWQHGPYRGPTIEDCALLIVGALFCLMAALMWPSDWRASLTILAFFGGCLLISATAVLRKMRERRFAATRVSIAGQVTIHAAGERLYAIAAGMIIVGCIIGFVDPRTPLLMRGIGAFIALVGLAFIVARVTGVYRRQYLRFEPAGLVLGQRRFSFRVPWDSIADIAAGEYFSNPIVLIRLADSATIDVDPPSARVKLAKELLNTCALMDADLAIMPLLYGLDSPPLLAALLRYAGEPNARQELAAAQAKSVAIGVAPRR